jgi:hypothetical protein
MSARKLVICLALVAALIGTTPVGAWPSRQHHTVHYYTLWNMHHEDVNSEGWLATYSMTHTTCESAALTTLFEAWADGWDVAPIAPVILDMERSFPSSSPCSITLGLR